MGNERSPGAPTTKRYTPEEKATAVRLVRQLRKELGWPQAVGPGGYRVVIEGDPRMVCDLTLEDSFTGNALVGGIVASAMLTLNAIPAVVAAPPGVVSVRDLPLITGRGAMRANYE